MSDVKVTYHEVFVLTKDGWTLHARYLGAEQKQALTEAKTAEAKLAAATKVVRTDYYPRTSLEEQTEIYLSRLAAGETDTRTPAPPRRRKVPAPARPAPVVAPALPAEPQSAGMVLVRLVGIMAAAALLAGLITTLIGAVFGDYLAALGGHGEQSRRSILFGTFIVFFLLVALPWILSFARGLGDFSFGFGNDALARRPPPKRKPHPARTSEPPPPQAAAASAEPAGPSPAAEAATAPDPLAAAVQESEALGDSAPPPEAAPQLDPLPAVAAEIDAYDAAEPDDPATARAARRRLEAARRPLLRFLSGMVSGLRQARTHLDAYERFGIGLLILGAGGAVADSADLRRRERRALLAEAMGVLGSQGARAAAMVDEFEAQAQEPRAARMVEAGAEAMRQFARGGQDFLAAVLTALEAWSRPSGATGTGVVAAVVVEAWPRDAALEDRVRAAAQTHGGAVVGMADGMVLLFAGAARAVAAATDLLPALPPAGRIGIDAVEAASEEEAVRCVGTARAACQSADPGRILVTTAVRGLCSRLPLQFRNVPPAGALDLAELVTEAAEEPDAAPDTTEAPATAAEPTPAESGAPR